MSINVLELMGMGTTAYVMIVIRRDGPTKEQESVLMRGDSSSGVQCVFNCGGRKEEERSGGNMRIMGGLERIGGLSF